MPYEAPSFDAIRSRMLRDIRSQLPDADITSDSDNHVRASSVSAIAEGIHQQAAWTARQIFPDSADFEELKRHAATRDVYPKSATPSGSEVTVTGTPGGRVLSGLQIRHVVTGRVFSTTAAVDIPDAGIAAVAVSSVETGAALNGIEGACVFVSPPLNVDSACTLVETAGGTDDESPESLLARLLDVMRNPPSGGNVADYRRWAMAVNGVSTALILPKRRGGNSIDVVITSSGGPSSEAVITSCQAYIEGVAPAGADVWVFTPEIVEVNLSAKVKPAADYTLESLQAPIETACKQVIAPIDPLETLYLIRLTAAISSLGGVIDLLILSPAGNIVTNADPSVVKWARFGSVQLQLLEGAV
ncbi:TPA: baseplate J/gp47 family protein [Pseudomonas putida]|uniref:baseplate J/gp47 family protein n=1 Tax=Pseudomonas sp. TaxID=306 RepID=UPI002647A3B9|nr:baseplate J/gp47 family protein [Pseudomonas sp.]MDN5520229.1 baseplate J/gp47 family protein [Pseudomonas sp.]MDN5531986.1 baseplate J/gp47 family protein [Pseudomonas sp.]